MGYKPKITIAIAYYNAHRFIKQNLDSIIKQAYKNWHVVLVDDCSKEGSLDITMKIIDDLKIKDKITIINHEQNYGYGRSLKDAIEGDNGDLIAIVDADDALSQNDALKIMVTYHADHKDAALVYSNHYICNSKLKPIRSTRSRSLRQDESYLGTKIKISHLKVIKRSFYNKTGGVNPSLLKTVDKDLVLRLEEVGKLVYCPETLYLYRQHPSSLTNSFNKRPAAYKRKVLKMKEKIYIDAKERRRKS